MLAVPTNGKGICIKTYPHHLPSFRIILSDIYNLEF